MLHIQTCRKYLGVGWGANEKGVKGVAEIKNMLLIVRKWKFLPEVRVFLKGRLLREVTLLLSAERATEGNGVGVSECDLSCIARPPEPQLLELCEP